MLFDDNYFLSDIPSSLFSKIVSLLDYNDSWKKLQKLEQLYEVIQPPITLPHNKSPGEYILNVLIEKLCTMGILRDIFLKSELYDALSIFYTENIRVIKQPTEEIQKDELMVQRNKPFRLEFSVFGIPQPKYQWYKDQELLSDQTSAELHYDSYRPEMAGDYFCTATQKFKDFATNTMKINELESDFVTIFTMHEQFIVKKMPLQEICRKMGDPDIILEVIVDGYPMPRFQWTHDNELLKHNKNKIKIPTNVDLTGIYRCYITNGINEITITSSIKIIDPNFKFSVCLEPVVEKIALLIGNEAYFYQEKLNTPSNDTKALQNKLESIGYLVLLINNLTLKGMIKAIEFFSQKMCCQDSIVLFYYAGHGFEFGEKYLMPIDVQKRYLLKDCVSEYWIFQEILSKQPKLFIALFDMCANQLDESENPEIFREIKQVFNFETKRNLLRGYATSTGYSSYEMNKIKHSFYNNILQDHITKKVPIIQMLRAVHSEFERVAKQTGNKIIAKQMPMITDNLSQDYYIDVEKTGYFPAKKALEDIHNSNKIKPNIT